MSYLELEKESNEYITTNSLEYNAEVGKNNEVCLKGGIEFEEYETE